MNALHSSPSGAASATPPCIERSQALLAAVIPPKELVSSNLRGRSMTICLELPDGAKVHLRTTIEDAVPAQGGCSACQSFIPVEDVSELPGGGISLVIAGGVATVRGPAAQPA